MFHVKIENSSNFIKHSNLIDIGFIEGDYISTLLFRLLHWLSPITLKDGEIIKMRKESKRKWIFYYEN